MGGKGEGPREQLPAAKGEPAKAKSNPTVATSDASSHNGPTREPLTRHYPEVLRPDVLEAMSLLRPNAAVPSIEAEQQRDIGPRLPTPARPLTPSGWRIGMEQSAELKAVVISGSVKSYQTVSNLLDSDLETTFEVGLEACFDSGLRLGSRNLGVGQQLQVGLVVTDSSVAKDFFTESSRDLQVDGGVGVFSVSKSWNNNEPEETTFKVAGGEGLIFGAWQPKCLKIELSKATIGPPLIELYKETIGRVLDALAVEIASQFSATLGYPPRP